VTPRSIGLGGDGDEVDAIERVEARFGILFDHADCERFVTVGDVWRALVKELRVEETDAAASWPDFVQALGEETLAPDDFDEIGFESTLMGGLTLGEALRKTFGL
jgi:hypothetical protein